MQVLDKMSSASRLLAVLRPLLRTLPPFLLGEALCDLTDYHYRLSMVAAMKQTGEHEGNLLCKASFQLP